VIEQLVDDSYKKFSFIQFSPDKTVELGWFVSYEGGLRHVKTFFTSVSYSQPKFTLEH